MIKLVRILGITVPFFFVVDLSTAKTHTIGRNNTAQNQCSLSGSVIGGVEDLGAVYYNPARTFINYWYSFFIKRQRI